VSLNDPELVSSEYATENGLEARRSVYANAVGPDPNDVLWDAIVAAAPRQVLEVGAGPGELSVRIARELDADVIAVDVSERMVELGRLRGVDARIGDVQDLALGDAAFDLVVAAWMLYHVPDLDRGLREIVRVLEPGGRLVAVTNSEHHMDEIRALAGIDMVGRVTFSRENGTASLRRHFAVVDQHDVDQWVTFPDAAAVRRFMSRRCPHVRAAADVPPVVAGAFPPGKSPPT